jgi:hypothetical protein
MIEIEAGDALHIKYKLGMGTHVKHTDTHTTHKKKMTRAKEI